jgi:hypothetical protein
MPFCTYLKNKLLDHALGKAAFTMPTVYVGLSTTTPAEGGTGYTEPTGNNYSRVATAAADWGSAASGSISNANSVTFPTTTGSWGTVTYFLVFDAASSGNLLMYGVLSTPRSVAATNTPVFSAGSLTATLT